MTKHIQPGFVLDCSVAATWCFEDEVSAYAEAVLDKLSRVAAVVPSLWRLETANVLVTSERRGRLTRSKSMQMAKSLLDLPILVDTECVSHALDTVLDLARDYNLTTYDAVYLELALRLNLPLATLDQALLKAARATGVELLKP